MGQSARASNPTHARRCLFIGRGKRAFAVDWQRPAIVLWVGLEFPLVLALLVFGHENRADARRTVPCFVRAADRDRVNASQATFRALGTQAHRKRASK